MRKNYLLFALCALFLFIITPHAYATDYTVEPTTAIKSNTVPMFMNSANVYGSITQQLFLPSEMKDADENTPSAGDITKITFYYAVKDGKSAAEAMSRDIEIWLMEIDDDIDAYQYDNASAYGNLYKSKFFFNASKKAGVKVYDGKLETNYITIGDGKQSLPLEITPFAWDGESNIVLTLFDKSSSSSQIGTDAYDNLRFYITETTGGRFVHWRWTGSATDDRATWMNNLDQYGDTYSSPTNTAEAQANTHRYVSLTTFTIVTPVPVPTSPSAGSITASSATLSWTAAAGADSYEVCYGTNSGSLGAPTNVGNVTSYSLSELEDETTYYYQIRTKKGSEYSAWTDEASFTTSALAAHIHDGISFSKWASTTTMPTSGNYYLNDDVAFDIMSSDVTLDGNLNLCLNGHTADLYGSKIIVPYGKTLAIYDNVGDGKITGHVASEVGAADIYAKALIVVYAGGELELHQGTIENAYIPDEDGSSYAIYSNGTLHLSGDVLINSNNTDIYLYSSNVIILDGAISNAEKHTVYKMGGDITYGWSTYMSGENPRDYFESSNSARAVFLDDDEAALRNLLHLSENSNNSSIGTNRDIVIDVALTRTLTSSQYNTFCLPFNLNNAQLEEHFGVGYDLEEFDHSNFDGETLELTFVRRYELTEGAPYLIKPAVDVVNPYFEGVTIYDGNPGSDEFDANIYFYSTFAPTVLASSKSILFLGANNELFWPESEGSIKAFRAYFVLQGAAASGAAKRARIVKQEDAATGLEQTSQEPIANSQKLIKDGQLIIERNGTFYNAQGQVIK